jgi:hypothetical protein
MLKRHARARVNHVTTAKGNIVRAFERAGHEHGRAQAALLHGAARRALRATPHAISHAKESA